MKSQFFTLIHYYAMPDITSTSEVCEGESAENPRHRKFGKISPPIGKAETPSIRRAKYACIILGGGNFLKNFRVFWEKFRGFFRLN